MSETSESNTEQAGALIGDYNAARKALTRSRLVITVAVLLTLLTFIYVGYVRVIDFIDTEVPVVTRIAQNEFVDRGVLSLLQQQLNEAVSDVIPRYQEAFEAVYARDNEKWFRELYALQNNLEGYAQEQWPLIEQSIVDMVEHQEIRARNALSQYLSPEDVDMLSKYYLARIEEHASDFYSEEILTKRQPIADSIFEQLQTIAETEPDLRSNNRAYVLGLLLELLGVEMQTYSDNYKQL